jgi:beta-glucosidase
LTTTSPNTLEETPAFLHYPGENYRHLYAEGIYVGYRYYDKRKIQPLFPFGFGLSYTQFEYEELKHSGSVFTPKDTIAVEVGLRNAGARTGKEVVQIYVEAPVGRLSRAPRELKAFGKVELPPGERRTVRLEIPVTRLAVYDPALSEWIVEAGTYRILVGASSRDIRLRAEVRIDAPLRLPPLKEDCSLTDLVKHAEAFSRVCELFARKSGASIEEATRLLESNAPDSFFSAYIALTTTFELNIDRDEYRRALYGR